MKRVRKLNTLRESLLATGYNGEIYGFSFIVADSQAKSMPKFEHRRLIWASTTALSFRKRWKLSKVPSLARKTRERTKLRLIRE